MKWLKALFRFYIQASIHVALAVTALVWLTITQLQLTANYHLLAFVFFASVSGYNFIKYALVAGLNHFHLSRPLRLIQLFSMFCALATLYFLLFLPHQSYLLLGILIALTFFYAIPLYKQKNLRGLTGLKLFFVALVWAGVTVLFPVITENHQPDKTVWLLFLQRFLLVIALTIPFEIRDLTNDDLALGTLPQRLGIVSTKFMGVALLIIVLMINKVLPSSPCFDVGLSVSTIILSVLILFSGKNQHPYYSSFWVEGIPILWVMIVLFMCG